MELERVAPASGQQSQWDRWKLNAGDVLGLLEVRADEGLADTVALGLENQVTWEHRGLPHGQFLP